MKKTQYEPQTEGNLNEPSEYKSYGDYYILDSPQGNNLPYSDEDDDDQLYLPLNDFAGDQDPEE